LALACISQDSKLPTIVVAPITSTAREAAFKVAAVASVPVALVAAAAAAVLAPMPPATSVLEEAAVLALMRSARRHLIFPPSKKNTSDFSATDS
jgi:hypothetical protein